MGVAHRLRTRLWELPQKVKVVLAVGIMVMLVTGVRWVPAPRVGSIETGEATSLALAGDFAYVGELSGGLRIIRITDPERPVEWGRFPGENETWEGGILDVVVSGEHAYVIDDSNVKIHIIDVSLPSQPRKVGDFAVPDCFCWRNALVVEGDYAYVATAEEVLIYEVSDPSQVAETGRIDFWGRSDRGNWGIVTHSGNWAYYANSAYDFYVIDISDPSDPVEVGHYHLASYPVDMVPMGDLVVVAVFDYRSLAWSGGIKILDVSDPTKPRLTGKEMTFFTTVSSDVFEFFTGQSIPTHISVRNLAVEGDYAFLVADDLKIFDISNPSEPVLRGTMKARGSAPIRDVAVSEKLIFLTKIEGGLSIFSLRDSDGDGYLDGADAYPDIRWLHAKWQGVLIALMLTIAAAYGVARHERRSGGSRAIRLLFVCTGNSARSQMAEGWARALAAERHLAERSLALRVASGGTAPAGVHPLAVEVMAEAGVDISTQRSRNLEEVKWRAADVAVTLCNDAAEACAALAWPARCRREHWSLTDPAAAPAADQQAAFRAARDDLQVRVAVLLVELAAELVEEEESAPEAEAEETMEEGAEAE